MKARILFVFLSLAVSVGGSQSAVAQSGNSAAQSTRNTEVYTVPSEALRREHWNYGVWADYGNGVGTRTDVHLGGAGFRIGRVLTGEHGSGWLRGTFEYDVDLTPVEIYHFPSVVPAGSPVALAAKNYYTGGFTPLIMKWNFTKGQQWVPFVAAEGGIVFSNGDMPQGDTSTVNFTSGAAFGFHRFVSSGNAWTFQGKIYHLSNASLGNHNPGVNAALQFKIGYTWFKR